MQNFVFSGDKLQKAGSYLGAAVLVGALRSDSSNGLNLVSAPALAKQLGVKVRTRDILFYNISTQSVDPLKTRLVWPITNVIKFQVKGNIQHVTI